MGQLSTPRVALATALLLAGAGIQAHAAKLILPALDVAKLANEDMATQGKRGVPVRYGIEASFKAILPQSNEWQALADGRSRWVLDVEGQQGKALELYFDQLRLPAGGELRFYIAGDKAPRQVLTDADNPANGHFRSNLMAGSAARIELTVPSIGVTNTRLQLASVTQAYRDPVVALNQLKSGSCNIDTACSEGDAYRDQIRAVAHYTFTSGGSGYVCTGQLMATGSSGDDVSAPRFSTAHHRVSTAAEASSMVLYWRYESPTCRTPGSAASGSPLSSGVATATQSGTSLLATHAPSDFTVVQLNSAVPAAGTPFYSGWDRSGTTPAGSVGIHHPSGDEKRITINTDALEKSASCIINGATASTHWYISEYEAGTTEGGSSGSGLWDPASKRLIGVLSGGDASCALPNEYDCYGRLDAGWTGGGTSSTRMSDWLLRNGSNATTVDGHSGCSAPTGSLSSSAFSGAAKAGELLTFTVTASGGTGTGYSYAWDLDGDGIAERTTTGNSVQLAFPSAFSGQAAVKVSDSSGCAGTISRALDVAGPKLIANAGTATQICGNNDTVMNPGERWRLPVSLQNSGAAASAEGTRALFANGDAASSGLDIGPNSFGYRGTSRTSGSCGYNFVDLGTGTPLQLSASGTNATANDDGKTTVIALGGSGLRLYGANYTQAVMSTNGYVSFAANESGGDYDNGCPGTIDRGSIGPRLNVLHDDLVVGSAAAAGLRYQYFASCPRAAEVGGAQACHVFQWENMQLYSNNAPTGDASFQAIVYASNGQVVYQYRRADPNSGAGATIGLIDATASDPLNASCNTASAGAQQAFCVFEPGNQPSIPTAQVRLETPTPILGASVAAGSSRSVNLDFQIPTSAACGSAVNLDYVASASGGIFSAERKVVFSGNVASGSCATVSNCPATSSTVTARQGFYNDVARSGNGLASFQYGGAALGAIWYTALADHTPTWYIVSGAYSDNLGRMSLDRFTNAGAPSGFLPQSASAGQAWWAMVDADTQMLAWQFSDGRRGAELMENTASGIAVGSPNHTQAWYNASQSGWGLGVESLNLPLEFWAVYLYDGAGTARWATGDTATLGNGTVNLLAHRPHCPGCLRYADWDSRAQSAGTLSRVYNGNTQATLNTNITLPAPLSGSWNRSNLTITTLGNPTP
jgi:lysyl endopeptidase